IIGISRFGSSSDVATRLALRRLGLDPDRDVSFIQVGSLQERFAAMQAGNIHGGLASPPQPLTLRRLGFTSLLDLASTGDVSLNNTGYAMESWLRANEAIAQTFASAMVEAIHYAKTHPELTQRVIARYLKLDDPEAAVEAYDFYVTRHLP